MPTASLPPPTAGAAPLGLDGYQLRLPSFEGPLDVLLRLVEREHLPITEVSLVAVTEQFLSHVDALDASDAAVVAGFAAVAGRLLVLKSRSLLPRPAVGADDGEQDDLVADLEHHRRLRAAALALARIDLRATGAHPLRPAPPTPCEPPCLAPHAASLLGQALRRRLAAMAPPPTPAPMRRIVSLDHVVARLLIAAGRGPALSLRAFLADADREFTLVSFLAILLLQRRRLLHATQAEPFGDIELTTGDRMAESTA